MKKVKNDSQPFIIYIIPIFVLPFVASFTGLFFYGILSSFDGVNFGSIYGILLSVIFLYLIIRAIKNGILYLSQGKNVILKMIIWFIEEFFYLNLFLKN